MSTKENSDNANSTICPSVVGSLVPLPLGDAVLPRLVAACSFRALHWRVFSAIAGSNWLPASGGRSFLFFVFRSPFVCRRLIIVRIISPAGDGTPKVRSELFSYAVAIVRHPPPIEGGEERKRSGRE